MAILHVNCKEGLGRACQLHAYALLNKRFPRERNVFLIKTEQNTFNFNIVFMFLVFTMLREREDFSIKTVQTIQISGIGSEEQNVLSVHEKEGTGHFFLLSSCLQQTETLHYDDCKYKTKSVGLPPNSDTPSKTSFTSPDFREVVMQSINSDHEPPIPISSLYIY